MASPKGLPRKSLTRPAAFAQIQHLALTLGPEDARYQRDVALVHVDGSVSFIRQAFLLEWYHFVLLFTKNQGYNVFEKRQLQHYAQYASIDLANVENLMSTETRCKHGMFFSGAGACPQCGRGAD